MYLWGSMRIWKLKETLDSWGLCDILDKGEREGGTSLEFWRANRQFTGSQDRVKHMVNKVLVGTADTMKHKRNLSGHCLDLSNI